MAKDRRERHAAAEWLVEAPQLAHVGEEGARQAPLGVQLDNDTPRRDGVRQLVHEQLPAWRFAPPRGSHLDATDRPGVSYRCVPGVITTARVVPVSYLPRHRVKAASPQPPNRRILRQSHRLRVLRDLDCSK